MNKLSPHLPAPSSNLRNHHMWNRLKYIFFLTFISIIASLAGSAMVIGWLWPMVGGGDLLISAYQRPSVTVVELEDKIKGEASSRLVEVYSRSDNNKQPISILEHKNKLGNGVMLSSDGWMAIYNPTSLNKEMTVIYSDGRTYDVEKIVFDKHSQINYLKIKTDDHKFKVINLPEDVNESDDLFVYIDNDWHYQKMGKLDYLRGKDSYIDIDIFKIYQLKNSGRGNVVINKQGRLAGFTNQDGNLIPATEVFKVLTELLENGTVSYRSLGIAGWYSVQQPIIVQEQMVKGFYVSKVIDSRSQLKVGDIITEINGVLVDSTNLWYIIGSKNNVKLKVLRLTFAQEGQNKTVELDTPVIIIK